MASFLVEAKKRARLDAKTLGDEQLRLKVRSQREQVANCSDMFFKQTNAITKVYEAEQKRRGLEGLPLFSR